MAVNQCLWYVSLSLSISCVSPSMCYCYKIKLKLCTLNIYHTYVKCYLYFLLWQVAPNERIKSKSFIYHSEEILERVYIKIMTHHFEQIIYECKERMLSYNEYLLGYNRICWPHLGGCQYDRPNQNQCPGRREGSVCRRQQCLVWGADGQNPPYCSYQQTASKDNF